MALSEAQKRSKKEYRKEKRTQISVEVSKEKKDEYLLAAQKLKLSLANLIKISVEEYIRKHEALLEQLEAAENPLTMREQMLLARFSCLPERAQRNFMRLMETLVVKYGGEADLTREPLGTGRFLTEQEKMLLARFNSLPRMAQQNFMWLMGNLAVKCGAKVDEMGE